jgi:DNA polymerase III subunit beta
MMKFQIQKRDFLRGLNAVQSVSGRRSTLPILSHVLLELKKDSLFLTGTDLETGIREELPVQGEIEGKASVSAKKLYEIVRELPEDVIHLQKKENHWMTIRCGRTHFNLAGLDPEEFPALPAFNEELFLRCPSALFIEMIEKTAFAASNEDSRYHLNGVLLTQVLPAGKEDPATAESSELPGKKTLRMVATDGHRLSLIDREGIPVQGLEKGIIIPKKGILEIRKLLQDRAGEESFEIYFNPTHGFLKVGKSLMIIRLIEGEFPDYEQVIPRDNQRKVIMDKTMVHGCLRRVSTMASERVEGVKLSLKPNLLELASYNQDYGDAREEVELAYDGESMEVGFNARYLLEALSVIGAEQVSLELKDGGSPGILRPPDGSGHPEQVCIIMPMRI